MLALAGCNLVMLKYFITREFATVLAASELTILLVGIAYFSGYSVGYGLAGVLSPRYLRLAAALTFPMHLGILLFSRVVADHLIMGGLGVWALVALLFLLFRNTT